jgi:hypothetical protein
MSDQYWLVLPNGGRQRIDPGQFDLDLLAEQARRVGGWLVVEAVALAPAPPAPDRSRFEPPVSALGPLFRGRLHRIYSCELDFSIDMNIRPTVRVLGGYYRKRRLVRVYTHDRQTGRRPLEELFDTFLHEVAHHLEYTEPHAFHARGCGRVRGRMHSRLFWRILGELKGRWSDLQRQPNNER